jgi:hypothetical protein
MAKGNPEALAIIAAQAYDAKNKIKGEEFRDAIKQNLIILLKEKNRNGGIKKWESFLESHKAGYSIEDIVKNLPEDLIITYQEVNHYIIGKLMQKKTTLELQ